VKQIMIKRNEKKEIHLNFQFISFGFLYTFFLGNVHL